MGAEGLLLIVLLIGGGAFLIIKNKAELPDINEMKDLLWTKVKTEDYEEPRKGYVPEDPNLRIEGEGEAFLPEIMIPKDDEHFKG